MTDPRDVKAEAALTERPKEPTKRLFVGFRVAVPVANSLAGTVETLARRGRDSAAASVLRWVVPANFHVTLKFLGATRATAVVGVRDALARALAGTAPLKVRCAKLGAFPDLAAAKVLWAGIDDGAGGSAVKELAAKVDAACVALGYPAETRAFHPHVTVARLKEARPVKDLVLAHADNAYGDTRVDALTLFASDQRGTMVIYRDVARLPFAAPPAPAAIAGPVTSEPETDDGWPRGHIPRDV